MICPDCGLNFKNLGAHKRFCKKRIMRPGELLEVNSFDDIIMDDYIKEKPLSSILSEIEGVLKSLHHQIQVNVTSENGSATEVELKVRFQLRR